MTKREIINKISQGESKAKELVVISVKQELYQIEDDQLSKEHYTILLSHYFSSIISEFNNLNNYYKASFQQFEFLNRESKNKLINKDRVDFIATILKSYLDWITNDDDELLIKNEAVKQIENIEEIVFETYLLKLKSEWVKNTLRNLKPSYKKETVEKNLSLKEVALLHIYNNEHIENINNANEIAKSYGHASGQKLLEHYNTYRYPTQRRNEDNKHKVKHLIKNIENIIPLLKEDCVTVAKDELNKLINNL